MKSMYRAPDKLRTLFNKIWVVEDQDEEVKLINRLCSSTDSMTVVAFFNQHAMNLAWCDADFLVSLGASDILLRDGIGLETGMRLMGIKPGINMNGTDFIPKLISAYIDEYSDASVYCFGTESPWLEAGSYELVSGRSKVICLNGFQSEEAYMNILKSDIFRRKLIVLGMGMPKQENLAIKIQQLLSGEGLIICGGAILDFSGGKVNRCPSWIQRLKMEWLYRLIKEPRRLFNRYVIGIPLFFIRLLMMRIH